MSHPAPIARRAWSSSGISKAVSPTHQSRASPGFFLLGVWPRPLPVERSASPTNTHEQTFKTLGWGHCQRVQIGSHDDLARSAKVSLLQMPCHPITNSDRGVKNTAAGSTPSAATKAIPRTAPNKRYSHSPHVSLGSERGRFRDGVRTGCYPLTP